MIPIEFLPLAVQLFIWLSVVVPCDPLLHDIILEVLMRMALWKVPVFLWPKCHVPLKDEALHYSLH